MLPKFNRRADATGDLARSSAASRRLPTGFSPSSMGCPTSPTSSATRSGARPNLADLGNPFTFQCTVLQKRRLASILVCIYQQKGTAPGSKTRSASSWGSTICRLRPSRPQRSSSASPCSAWIGARTRTRFARYAFEATVSRVLTDTERASVQALVRYMKPAHTHFVAPNEPVVLPVFDGWEIGTSEAWRDHRSQLRLGALLSVGRPPADSASENRRRAVPWARA